MNVRCRVQQFSYIYILFHYRLLWNVEYCSLGPASWQLACVKHPLLSPILSARQPGEAQLGDLFWAGSPDTRAVRVGRIQGRDRGDHPCMGIEGQTARWTWVRLSAPPSLTLPTCKVGTRTTMASQGCGAGVVPQCLHTEACSPLLPWAKLEAGFRSLIHLLAC